MPSVFPVTGFSAAAVGAACLALAELISVQAGHLPKITVDRRLTSFWLGLSLRTKGWDLPPVWDAIAGDYAALDGWVRLHTNAPHHRAKALSVLGVQPDKNKVIRAVSSWRANDLEAAIISAGGCAAAMRSLTEWAQHPQGRAVAEEPLLHISTFSSGEKPNWRLTGERPLADIRVLDLTRVLAGPVATRFLAGYGADVLRIDPPFWEEPAVVPEMTVGKRCAHLDLRVATDRATLERRLAETDVFIHGYRPGALAQLGFDAARRRELNPGLIDVSLNAYGWNGPWKERRGFDSLVQMSCGIAEAGMRQMGRDRPTPLPAQALDHATGYLMAAAALRGLTLRATTGEGSEVRASLARTANLLAMGSDWESDNTPISPEHADDLSDTIEKTAWGEARRLKPPAVVDGYPMRWDRPAGPLGASIAQWKSGS